MRSLTLTAVAISGTSTAKPVRTAGMATAFVVMLTWTHLAEPMLRRARSLARQPTASRAVDLAERQRLARERQAEAFQRASEKNTIRARERRAREAVGAGWDPATTRNLPRGPNPSQSPRTTRTTRSDGCASVTCWLLAPRAGTNRRNGWSTREAEDGKRPSTESLVKTLEGRSRLRFAATTP